MKKGEFKRIKDMCMLPCCVDESTKEILKMVKEAKKEFPMTQQGVGIDYVKCLRLNAERRDWFMKWFGE